MPKRKIEEKIDQLERRLERYKKKAQPPQPQSQSGASTSSTAQIPEPDPEVPETDPELLDLESETIMDESDSEELDTDILSALGESTNGERQYGEKVHDQIFNTIRNIIVEGLPKPNKEKLLETLLVPSNCKLLDAPKLNTELLGVVNNPSKTRDKLLEERQQELGLAIAGLCQVIHSLSKKDYDKLNIIKKLSDVSRVLSNLHFQYTEIRRKLINPYLDKNLTESLKDNKREAYLYSNLDDSIKSFSAIKRASNVIKPKSTQVKPQSKNYQTPPRRLISNQAHPMRGSLQGGTHQRYQPRHPYKPQENRHAGPSLRGRAKYP